MKEKIEALTKENSEYMRKLNQLRNEYDDKVIEYEELQEQHILLKNNNSELEKSFERNFEVLTYLNNDLFYFIIF